MEEERLKKYRTVSFAVVTVWLIVLVIGLSVVMFSLLEGVAGADAQVRKWHMRLALVCLVLLGGTLVLLAWTIMRYFRYRAIKYQRHPPTPYVDAWAIAGQRFRLEDEDQDEDEDENTSWNDGEDDDQ